MLYLLQERITFSPHPKTLTMAGDYEYFAAQVGPPLPDPHVLVHTRSARSAAGFCLELNAPGRGLRWSQDTWIAVTENSEKAQRFIISG